MKRIIIYFFCVIAIGCLTGSILYWEKDTPKEITLEKPSGEVEASETTENSQVAESVLKISNVAYQEYRFCVKAEDIYLVVYEKGNSSIYDTTAILVEALPEHIKLELENGLYFLNEQELYEFLENYSS